MLLRIVFVGLLFILAMSCKREPKENPPSKVKPKEGRRYGFHITTTELGTYDQHFQLAKQAGMEVVPITMIWNQIEKGELIMDATMPEIANAYYASQGTSLCLTISPGYATQKAVPEDLKHLAWNDPTMISRFKQFLSYLKQKMPAVAIAYLSIGNEVDLYLTNDVEWNAYRLFFEAARLHAKSLWGNHLPVGTEGTWTSLTTTYASQLQSLNQTSDYIQVSYYPLESDFTMRPPESFATDMDQLFASYPGRKIVIEETGYATSAVCNSSPEKQQQYVETIFKWWDKHADQVPFMGFLWLNDLSEQQASQFASDYGLPGNTTFKEYLRTTAFRTWNGKGQDKAGFIQLKTEAKARVW